MDDREDDAIPRGEPDSDGDGVPDSEDCAPLTAAISGVPTALGPSLGLDAAGALGWTAEPDAESYNVYRAIVLAGRPWSYDTICLAIETTATSFLDDGEPGPGEQLYYLVSKVNCFGEGSLGTDPDGDPRPNFQPCTDGDADGHPDSTDNCPSTANPDQADYDADKLGDLCDPDDDNDGLSDIDESSAGSDPFNPDSDGDGIVDGADCQPLSSSIGDVPTVMAYSLSLDGTEQVFWGAESDAESYNLYRGALGSGDDWSYAQICIVIETPATMHLDSRQPATGELLFYLASKVNCFGEGPVGLDSAGFPRPNALACIDTDTDGQPDSVDNCPMQPNPDQADFDGDLSGDVCDADDDNDGLTDLEEIMLGSDPLDLDSDDDGLTDGDEVFVWGSDLVDPDTDDDTLLDGQDNCPLAPNPGQENADADVFGDACDWELTRGVADAGGRSAVGAGIRLAEISVGQTAAGDATGSDRKVESGFVNGPP